jgi:predicted SAM-dependent methyltransferase
LEAAAGETAVELTVDAVTKFFNSVHVHGYVKYDPPALPTAVQITFESGKPESAYLRSCTLRPNGFAEFEAQFMYSGDTFPAEARLDILAGTNIVSATLGELAHAARSAQPRPLVLEFEARVNGIAAERGTADVLDLGGRARSGGPLSANRFPNWNVTVADIVPGAGVDIVADAHELSFALAGRMFDAVYSVSVFEHLLMPWKACVEMSRILRIGGLVFIHTHQTIGMHDMPWDFWRFSDTSWKGLFNDATGFEILETQMADFVNIVPRVYSEIYLGAEYAGGFLISGVLARKISAPRVDWQVRLSDLVATTYPGNA